MDSFIETFHIDWMTMIAQAINFVIVLFIVNLLAIKPLKKLMKERSGTIKKGLDDATKNEELLSKTHKEYNNIVAKAKAEAYQIFEEGKKDAESKKVEILENAQLEVDKMINNGKKSLESEKAKMIEEAKGEIVSLVVKATEKLLESSDSKNFDDKTLKEIKKM